jgi:hypothetical protein
MPSNSESQCYFVQLQIDSFLDGDLGTAQQEVFILHVHNCEPCAREFHYAQTVQDAVLDLPLLDCDEQVLEPIHRLTNSAAAMVNDDAAMVNDDAAVVNDDAPMVNSGAPVVDSNTPIVMNDKPSWWAQLAELLNTAPLFLRYGFPVAVVAIGAAVLTTSVLSPELNPGLSVASSELAPGELLATELAAVVPLDQYSPQEVRQALLDLNLAIDYLNQVSERTEVMISNRFVITPLQDSLNASFERVRTRNGPQLQNDPI